MNSAFRCLFFVALLVLRAGESVASGLGVRLGDPNCLGGVKVNRIGERLPVVAEFKGLAGDVSGVVGVDGLGRGDRRRGLCLILLFREVAGNVMSSGIGTGDFDEQTATSRSIT
jgi:hypothetical protein